MIKEELQQVNDGFDISNHRFLNMIANGISKLIAKDVPGLKLRYTGKSIKGNVVSAVLIGEIHLNNPDELDRASDKVKTTMQGLKNPTNLIEVIE